MIKRARRHCAGVPNITLDVGDALAYSFEKSDFVVSYYCIQFISPRSRQEVFNRIYERLHWGGAFVLFEKVRAPDARLQDMVVSLYNDTKKREGFSADEILNRTASLKAS
jgi:tRNA (cmo5U34)-methyltransferase